MTAKSDDLWTWYLTGESGSVGSNNGVNEIDEIMVSEDSAKSADLATSKLETHHLDLKGIDHPVSVSVIQIHKPLSK